MKNIEKNVILFQKKGEFKKGNYEYLLIPEWKVVIYNVQYNPVDNNSQIEFKSHGVKSNVLAMRDIYEKWSHYEDDYNIIELEGNNKALSLIKNYDWSGNIF